MPHFIMYITGVVLFCTVLLGVVALGDLPLLKCMRSRFSSLAIAFCTGCVQWMYSSASCSVLCTTIVHYVLLGSAHDS